MWINHHIVCLCVRVFRTELAKKNLLKISVNTFKVTYMDPLKPPFINGYLLNEKLTLESVSEIKYIYAYMYYHDVSTNINYILLMFLLSCSKKLIRPVLHYSYRSMVLVA